MVYSQDRQFSEQKSIDLLCEKHKEIIADFYFPLGRRIYKNENGEEKVRFTPVLQGLFFIRVKDEKSLQRILSEYGYFMYKGVDYAAKSSEVIERTFFTKAHLLCADSKSLTLDEIVKQARIPDDDMERFIYYNDKIGEGIEGLSIVDKRYDDLILVNDTVRILSGPMSGWVGVVKQIKNKGRKDRHLLVRFGNNHCLNISNIRQYDMQIEHEATKGDKSKTNGVWRAIDQMVGYLQAKDPSRNASETLRKLFTDYHKKQSVYRGSRSSDTAYGKKNKDAKLVRREEILANIDESMQNNFCILANFFRAEGATLEKGLNELIPDTILRPFLTPTSGAPISEDSDYAVLCHDGIIELIRRCNLRQFFRGKGYEADKYEPVFDEDYEYYAHFALIQTESGSVKAICSWGGFYDYYASLNDDERNKFHADLESKKYPLLLSLLTQSEYKFEKVRGIGGFSLGTDIVYTDDIEELGRRANEYFALHASLFSQLSAAAVEVWQGARLLVWRQFLQRYVLLHKVPVVDQPLVISQDAKLEEAFVKVSGTPDIVKLSQTLEEVKESVEENSKKGKLTSAVFHLLSASLVFSSHFAQDELYNYIGDTFNPDKTLTCLFDGIIKHIRTQGSSPSIIRYLHKGIAELQMQDSWTYFKFPSYLKQSKAVEKILSKTAKSVSSVFIRG